MTTTSRLNYFWQLFALLIGAILFSSYCFGYPRKGSCDSTLTQIELPSEEQIRQDRETLLKNYLYFNLIYPQTNEGIVGGMVALFFANELEFDAFTEPFDGALLNTLYHRMAAAHGGHNVGEISFEQLQGVLDRASDNMLYAIHEAIGFVAPELTTAERNLDLHSLVEVFYSLPQYADARRKLKNYSKSILQMLRSKPAIAAANAFRDAIKNRSKTETNLNRKKLELYRFIKSKVIEDLETNFSELKTKQIMWHGYILDTYKTRAEILWYSVMFDPSDEETVQLLVTGKL